MDIQTLNHPDFEEIVSCTDADSGLRAIIAIHSRRLGPALGGIRMYPYANDEEALRDVTLLARAMTYKAAAARLRLGGGKAVILGDPAKDKTKPLLQAMGRFINALKGRYISAKDAGITTADLVEISQATGYVTGLPESMGGSGDPSPWTAQGILEGIRACVREKSGRERLAGLRVVIQGVGAVGFSLAGLLHRENVQLTVADTDRKAAQAAQEQFGAEAVSFKDVYSVPGDLFAPCALGGILNDETLPRLRFSMIAGGANNQLSDEIRHDGELLKRKILYAPDYIVNAGGLINIYVKDILKEKDPTPWIRKIYENLLGVFACSRERGVGTHQAANQMTEEFLASPA